MCLASSNAGPNDDEILWEKCYEGSASPYECNQIDCAMINDPDARELCLGSFGELIQVSQDSLALEKRDDIPFMKEQYDFFQIDPQDLYSSQPISINIAPGERFQYQYQINMSDPSAQEYYEIMVFVTANLCAYPHGIVDPNQYLRLYYTFNNTGVFTNNSNEQQYDTAFDHEDFKNGYLQALAYTNAQTNDSFYLDLVLEADEMKDPNGSFTIQLGVSQEDLVFQWDNRTWISMVDSDDTTALFITGNLTTSYSNATEILESSSNYYTIHVFLDDESNYFEYMNRSWCSVVNAKELISQDKIVYSFTSRSGGIKEQIYVTGLEPSTNYIAYVTQDFFHKENGGVVFDRLFFRTQEPDTCQLVFNLTFCEHVAYSVPKSSNLNIDSSFETLGSLYDEYAENIYNNFSKAIQQIACDAEDDQRYSPIVSCDDCALAYKNWLCGVTIPRCTTSNQTQYKFRDLKKSRNEYINQVIDPPSPYFEILPCIDMCHSIVRACSSDFGFACPEGNHSITKSYWFRSDDTLYDTCNYVGSVSENIAGDIPRVEKALIVLNFIVVYLFLF